MHYPFELVVWNVRSRHNVGSFFRTSDAVGITRIHLCGITPAPPHPRIAKVSLGAEHSVPFDTQKRIVPLLKKMKRDGFTLVALEQTPTSIPYTKFLPPRKPIALIVGSEVDGVSPAALSVSDVHIHIPMHGLKESLNVSVALGIASFRIAYP